MAMNIDSAGGMIHTQAIVSFYNGAQINQGRTSSQGRPIYDDVEMVRIQWAGNTKSELHAPANDRSDRAIVNPEDRSKFWPKWKDHPDFAKAYAAFKAGEASTINGTPIAELPFLTDARRLELKAINILSAEQLANLDSQAVQKLGMGIAQLKQQAKDYLARAAGAAVDAKHEQERQAMQSQIDELRALLTGPAAVAGKVSRAKVEAADSKPVGDFLAKAEAVLPPVPSAFDIWEPADIRNWMKEADPTAPAPHHNCSPATLARMADEMNARLKAASGQLVAA